MPVKILKPQIEAHSTVETKAGKTDTEYKQVTDGHETIPGKFDSNGMLLAIDAGQTINQGNFNSARIGFHLTIPCSPENLEEAYAWGLKWLSDKMSAEVGAAKGQ